MTSLLEVFDSPRPFEWTYWSKRMGYYTAEFKTGGGETGYQVKIKGGPEEYELSFEDHNGYQVVTGSGRPFEVFATVISIATDFLSKIRPLSLKFEGAKSEGRGRLYAAMLQKKDRVLRKMGYQYKSKDQGRFVTFHLIRAADGTNLGADVDYEERLGKMRFLQFQTLVYDMEAMRKPVEDFAALLINLPADPKKIIHAFTTISQSNLNLAYAYINRAQRLSTVNIWLRRVQNAFRALPWDNEAIAAFDAMVEYGDKKGLYNENTA